MKQKDIQCCAFCGEGLMHNQSICCYRVCITQMVFDRAAIQRQHGLETMLGAAAPLSQVLGPNEDIAVPVVEGCDRYVCMDCSVRQIPGMLELLGDEDKKETQT